MEQYKKPLAGLATISVLCLLVWWFITALFTSLSGMDASVAAALIAAVVTVLTGMFTFFRDRQKARQEVHREKKVEVYSLFYDMMFGLMQRVRKQEDTQYVEGEDFQNQMLALMRGVIFYGSPGVVQALAKWKVDAASNPNPTHVMMLVGDILLAMRADIGLSNVGLTNLSIHQVYVRDSLEKMSLKEVV